ncbi:MAG: DUF4254 domain-containing protein [Sulfuricella sp.]
MFSDIPAQKVSLFHESKLMTPIWARSAPVEFDQGIWKCIELNHRFNNLLWDEEDLARRKNVPDSEIAANKRAIDGYNQKRNDAIENIDDLLLQRLAHIKSEATAWLNSETAGSIIDRLSIISLKIFHMRLQTQRNDVEQAHIDTCQQKLSKLTEQRADLQYCLDTLLTAASLGRAYFKIYRQFKMYNDPALNPCIYQAK